MKAELIPTILEIYQLSLVSLISQAVDAEVDVTIDVNCPEGLGETLPDLGKAAGWSVEDHGIFAVAKHTDSPYRGIIKLFGSNRLRADPVPEEDPA